MKKNKILFVTFQSWGDFKKDVTAAFKEKKSSHTPKDTVVFSSVTEYQKFMSEQKLAILAVIASKKPTSIYQLAQLVDRDFANVQRDCVGLAAHGFMKFEEAGDAHNSKIPQLAFNYTRIEVHMPQVTYSHELGDAA